MSGSGQAVGVSIVMPCLNEIQSLPHCVGQAKEALAGMQAQFGLTGEVVIADNGSTDGSQALATSLGARVVPVSERGYGAALRGGFAAAEGRFLVMGDCDGSYDFRDAIPMIEALLGGADLCMGSRFKGGIAPGAMPWKNRYIGNPVLTGILNLLFKAKVDDAHCGLRALTKACFERLHLTGSGMEFASEMVIKAALRKETIAERPATLSRDLRDRPPHLRPWRDGWRHLRYLFMLSPASLFTGPAVVGAATALSILGVAVVQEVEGGMGLIGNYWVILASALLGLSHISAVLALAAHLYGVREGYQQPSRWTLWLAKWVSLETMILTGVLSGLIGLGLLTFVVLSWSARNFIATYSVVPVVTGAMFMTLGAQNVLGGFLLAIIGGNEARFMARVASDIARTRPAQAGSQTAKHVGR